MEREVGGGIGMGNTCKPLAVSFQCMTKPTTNKKKKRKRKKKIRKKNSIYKQKGYERDIKKCIVRLFLICSIIVFIFFFSFIFISWRLITQQYCSGFCHELK